MMGPQILLFKRFQTHRQFANKAQFEDSFTSQLTADAFADVKEDLGTFPKSALTAEQTRDDYHELIDITTISWALLFLEVYDLWHLQGGCRR